MFGFAFGNGMMCKMYSGMAMMQMPQFLHAILPVSVHWQGPVCL